jgi:hypothetical protein
MGTTLSVGNIDFELCRPVAKGAFFLQIQRSVWFRMMAIFLLIFVDDLLVVVLLVATFRLISAGAN